MRETGRQHKVNGEKTVAMGAEGGKGERRWEEHIAAKRQQGLAPDELFWSFLLSVASGSAMLCSPKVLPSPFSSTLPQAPVARYLPKPPASSLV